ncbi:MAG TPA: sulfurtransferase [Verrucomicrobiae bacterium]
MPKFHNIAAYKFAPLKDLKERRADLLAKCKGWGLKGTILLSTEGINLFVAGLPDGVQELVKELRGIPGLAELPIKLSESEHQPFNRMLVRIKREIIAFGVPEIDPGRYTSPRVSARTLKQWLDEGRPVTLLDTRNDYEVKLGTFKNALPAGIDHFRDFPEAVEKLPQELKEQPIVTFCTGGIRCEKAAPFMERAGFKNIFQLDGGILKYFEECGGAHYDGECFVFDQRVGVDPSLHETESDQCFVCLTPLNAEDQKDQRYVAGRSCPYCFKTSEEQQSLARAARQKAIRRATTPLPGSVAYDNFRPISVPTDCDGLTLLAFLGKVLKHVPALEWDDLCERGLMLDRARKPVAPNHIVHSGERYFQKLPSLVEPEVSASIEVLHEDEATVVLNKPAPLPMHPGGRFNRNTLQYILEQVYHPQKPRPAHRLDANTTGLVLITRTRHFASKLQPQFARGEVVKTYLAKIHGTPKENSFTCDAPISAEAGEAGTRIIDLAEGLQSRTEFRVRERFADGTTLVEARPITGRTNQIRAHLWQLGFPIVGDPVYLRDGKLDQARQTLDITSEPLCLHAWRLGFLHPLTNEKVSFEASAPEWVRGETAVAADR